MKIYLAMPRDLERLRNDLQYDPATGNFTVNRTGNIIGYFNTKQRRSKTITYRGICYSQGRLAWYWVTGEDPKNNRVIYKDGNAQNCAWANLALVPAAVDAEVAA